MSFVSFSLYVQLSRDAFVCIAFVLLLHGAESSTLHHCARASGEVWGFAFPATIFRVHLVHASPPGIARQKASNSHHCILDASMKSLFVLHGLVLSHHVYIMIKAILSQYHIVSCNHSYSAPSRAWCLITFCLFKSLKFINHIWWPLLFPVPAYKSRVP